MIATSPVVGRRAPLRVEAIHFIHCHAGRRLRWRHARVHLTAVIQRRQERKAVLLNAHRILFCLLHQINTLVLIQRDFI